MSWHPPASQVISIPDTTPDMLWRWAVLPVTNPYIYIPMPTREQAQALAGEVDAGARPETFVTRRITERMRDVYQLAPLPPSLLDMPHLPGFGAWEPVSRATAGLLRPTRAARVKVDIPGIPGLVRSLYLAAAPQGCSVARLAMEAEQAAERAMVRVDRSA